MVLLLLLYDSIFLDIDLNHLLFCIRDCNMRIFLYYLMVVFLHFQFSICDFFQICNLLLLECRMLVLEYFLVLLLCHLLLRNDLLFLRNILVEILHRLKLIFQMMCMNAFLLLLLDRCLFFFFVKLYIIINFTT